MEEQNRDQIALSTEMPASNVQSQSDLSSNRSSSRTSANSEETIWADSFERIDPHPAISLNTGTEILAQPHVATENDEPDVRPPLSSDDGMVADPRVDTDNSEADVPTALDSDVRKISELHPHDLNDTVRRGFIRDGYRRLGWLVVALVIGGTLGVFGVIGFWAFLWFADDSNQTWYNIMSGDHIKVIVSSTAEVVNRLVSAMLGAECSMIIALGLERAEVLFPNLASAAMGRKGGSSTKSILMIKRILQRKWPSGLDIRLPVLIFIISILESLTLGTHTVLLSDVKLDQLPLRSNTSILSFGLTYTPSNLTSAGGQDVVQRNSPWLLKPPSYPTFAEYTEKPIKQDGVSDTGLTLRAFLPYADPTRRQLTHSYSGQTTVLDARVTCQAPVLGNFEVQPIQDSLLLGGYVRASTFTPRLGNQSWVNDEPTGIGNPPWIANASVPFACNAPLVSNNYPGLPDQWRTSICQLSETDFGNGPAIAGGLVSEFKNYTAWLANITKETPAAQYGSAYLVFNVSTGVWEAWSNMLTPDLFNPSLTSVPEGRQVNEWISFSFPYELSFSVTLCYAALDTADIPVTITSSKMRNRTEPQPNFNFTSRQYTFEEVRNQYGQGNVHASNAASSDTRGVLELEKQSWIAPPGVQPPSASYIRNSLDFGYPADDGDSASPYTLSLINNNVGSSEVNITAFSSSNASLFHQVQGYLVVPDPMHVWLFQDIVSHGGSIAFALQSLLTCITSMTYYDQLAQFDNSGPVSQSTYIETNLPQNYWGFLAVVIALAVHIVVCWIVLAWFLLGTRFTILGQSWQSLAQASTAETAEFIGMAGGMTDDEVKAKLKEATWAQKEIGKPLNKARVKLGVNDDRKVGIFIVR